METVKKRRLVRMALIPKFASYSEIQVVAVKIF